MLNLPTERQQIYGPLIIAAVATLLFLAEPFSNQWLAYDRHLIALGEWWRIATGNLLHTNLYHLLLNLAGLSLLWALHGDYYKTPHYLLVLTGAALGCSIGILLFAKELIWYVGLSGALHGLFVWGAVIDVKNKLYSGWLLLIGVAAKIVWEQTQGSHEQVSSLIEAQVAVDAHLYGALSGLIIVLVTLALNKVPNVEVNAN